MPLALAVNCLLEPVTSICRLLNAAVPLPAPEPMSTVEVPCRGPVPALNCIDTLRLAGSPDAEILPKASWLRMTGCVPKTDPAVALPGCVAKTRALAVAALTEMVEEVVLVRLPLVNRIVILVATLCERLLNVATPSEAVAVTVPCKGPLPALRAGVAPVELSA